MIEDDPEEARARRAELDEQQQVSARRAAAAHAKAIPAFERLLVLTETRMSGQIDYVAQFIAATHNGRFHFDLFNLRVLDESICDDMLACLDCLAWATSDLYRLVPGGQARVEAVITKWNLRRIT